VSTPDEALRLCDLTDVPDGACRGFDLVADELPRRVFLVRRGLQAFVYQNRCPHVGSPLDWQPHQFLDREGQHIQCATHGALFRIHDGVCVAGPCTGDQLHPLPVELRDGGVYVRAADVAELDA
jgi:nitrite reductase/ring-hydroxylating ferredoxin subunit